MPRLQTEQLMLFKLFKSTVVTQPSGRTRKSDEDICELYCILQTSLEDYLILTNLDWEICQKHDFLKM